jgi:hypothetical protein
VRGGVTERAPNNTAEWQFQTHAYVYCRAALPPHAYVRGVDSGQAAPMYVKVARSRRGIKPGAGDLRILCDGISLDLELKVHPNKPTENQLAEGEALRRNGGFWFVAYTLADVEQALRDAGLPVLRTAAQHEIAVAVTRTRPKKSRNWSHAPKKPSARLVAAWNRAQRP